MLKNKLFIFGLMISMIGVILLSVAFVNVVNPFYYSASACFYMGAVIQVYSLVKESKLV